MNLSLLFVLERAADNFTSARLNALGRVVEAHPVLAPLLDFCATDPQQIALAVGMVYAGEEDGPDDLQEIDFGPDEWFEPEGGLAVVRRALEQVRADPGSIAAAIYDPSLRAEQVMADLETLEQALLTARQRETRFHLLQVT